ncbi:MFS transporter [Sphaerisporangium sp. NPDC051011]|uniref:MFS transporter n=1 Tax=Sphaerisporangium sp. NPDC051011 TaxID=3155792 RepID=UPI0033ECB062
MAQPEQEAEHPRDAGFAIGGTAAALIVSARHDPSYALLYGLDAASFLLAIPLMFLWPVAVPPADPPEHAADGGYRAVVSDRVFLRLWLLIAVLVTAGYAQFTSALPAYTAQTGLGAGMLAIAFTVNMVTVTLAQLLVLRVLHRIRRRTALLLLCLSWAVTWALVLASGRMSGWAAVAAVLLAALVFGLGETLMSPTVPPLVNELAPESLRGRYNGAATLAYTTGFAIGPVIAGALLERELGTVLFVALIAACGMAAVLATRLPAGPPGEEAVVSTPQAVSSDLP